MHVDSGRDGAPERLNSLVQSDAASQITLLNAFDSEVDYDSTAVQIWDNRYDSALPFGRYLRYCVCLGWQECLRISAWLWRKSWTAEVGSFLFAVLALVGLVLVLSLHHGQPIPEWPHMITINSVVSLFALCMRIGVGVVLAEGYSSPLHTKASYS